MGRPLLLINTIDCNQYDWTHLDDPPEKWRRECDIELAAADMGNEDLEQQKWGLGLRVHHPTRVGGSYGTGITRHQ